MMQVSACRQHDTETARMPCSTGHHTLEALAAFSRRQVCTCTVNVTCIHAHVGCLAGTVTGASGGRTVHAAAAAPARVIADVSGPCGTPVSCIKPVCSWRHGVFLHHYHHGMARMQGGVMATVTRGQGPQGCHAIIMPVCGSANAFSRGLHHTLHLHSFTSTQTSCSKGIS